MRTPSRREWQVHMDTSVRTRHHFLYSDKQSDPKVNLQGMVRTLESVDHSIARSGQ